MINKTLQLESFGLTDVGLVRDHNEDTWAAYPEQRLFILADGMGGHACGEVASKEAVDHLHTLFNRWKPSKARSVDEVTAFFEEAFAQVNTYIYKQGQHDDELKGMGTTLSALFFFNDQALVAHVGDSRIYRFRKGRLKPLTEDHSLVAELIALGAMGSAEADSFPYRHILTRAIGTHARVEATIDTVPVEPNDLFLLCSDGLTNYLSTDQMVEVLEHEDSLPAKGKALVDGANQNGGGDNITLVLVETGYDLS